MIKEGSTLLPVFHKGQPYAHTEKYFKKLYERENLIIYMLE